ncbi:cytochrome P450 [Thelephora terrestris]|uniref:Cytochrome P450 n=1 Tax=Thelephora terrestris TaxID=56493 RepID=A0A9P6LBJ3_9AGAM|nr:cytochrome P450 [Thelephora terrestris]
MFSSQSLPSAHIGQAALIGIPSCAAIYFVISRFLRPPSSTFPCPPGPKPLPLIGNVLDVPLSSPWLVYTQWAKRYGEITSFAIFGQRVVVINSLDVARDVLNNRSGIYSDRPRLVMGGELCGWDRTTVLVPYGPKLKGHRLIFSRGISAKRSLDKYHSVMEHVAQTFASGLASDSNDLIGQIHRSIADLQLAVIYDYTAQGRADPLVDDTERVLRYFTMILEPGAYLVDTLSFLKYLPNWFPGAGFKRTAIEWRALLAETSGALFNRVPRTKADAGRGCLVSDSLEENGTLPEVEELVRWSSFTLFAAGIDTISSVLTCFFLAMTMFPDVYKKAREELSLTLGDGVLPSVDDGSRLPYLNAVIQETIRWGVVGPLGVPHAALEDDVYKGYSIPKGAVVVVNVWGICHDPEVYSNPDQFLPERFMGETPEPDLEFMFGFGRRKCPGMNYSLQYLSLVCATSLVMLDISKATDDSGAVLEPKLERTERVINTPKPFPCKIRKRR